MALPDHIDKKPHDLYSQEAEPLWIADLTSVFGNPTDLITPDLRPETMHEGAIFSFPNQVKPETLITITRTRRDRALISNPHFRVHIRHIEGKKVDSETFENVLILPNPDRQQVTLFTHQESQDPEVLCTITSSGQILVPEE